MNGDTGDAPTLAPSTATAAATPVRRSARTRKPNSRFADDEVGGCFKKIVSGIGSPEATAPAPTLTPGRPRKATGRRKDSRSEDRSDEGEDKGERGRKDSREEEKGEELEERSERGRKLSEEAEEKSEKRRKEKSGSEEVVGEERSEVVKKAKQNEEQVESVEEKDERRKENRSEDVEEETDRRKLSESEKEEKRRRDSQCEESREEKPPTNSLHNGLEGVEEFVRITRSGRREEEPRRKPVRKRGKGKEEEREENETVADNPKTAPEDKSKDPPVSKISKPVTQEGSTVVEESPHPPTEPAKKPDSEKGSGDKECAQPPSVGLEVKDVREGAEKGTASPMDADPPPPLQKEEEEDSPSSQRDTVHRRLQGQVVTVSLTRLTRTNSTAASMPPTTSTPTTATTTTTTTKTVTSTTTPTTTSVATTTAPAITTSTTTSTKITTITSHPRQPAPKLIPPQAPAEPPPDPRLNRGQRSNLVTLVGGPVSPRAPSTQGSDPGAASPPSIPPPSPATRGKEGVVLAPGNGQDARDSARGCERGASSPQKVKSASAMENIPLPSAALASMPSASPSSPSSPKHSRQEEEEALRKAGGKRERSEKEGSPAKPVNAKEDKEPEITSPQAKKRKEDQKEEEEETREESKQEETKKRLGDAKEEDQRKRRKVEEEEEEEEVEERHSTPTPTSQRETPHCPTLADIHMPPEPPPAVPPPVPPLPKKPPVTPQNSPTSKKDAILSPRVEREAPREKESPTRNRDSQRSGNPTHAVEKEAPREIKDSRDEKDAGKGEKEPLKGNTNSLRSVEREKSEEVGEQRSVSEREAREDSGKGGDKDEVKGKEEVTRGDRDTGKSKETVKSDSKDQSKTETRDKGGEKDAVRGRTEATTVDREAGRGRSERETNRSTRDQTRKREEVSKSDKEEPPRQGERDKNKSKRESLKEEKDEKESVNKRTQITNLLDIPMPSDTPPTPPTHTTTHTQDTLTTKGLFSHNTEDQGGLGSFLGFSSSSTTIPFLEDTTSPASECEIPGLSIIASSSPKTNAPKKPAKDDQSHRSWFAFRGGRRSQTNGQSETQSNGSDKENKSKEEEEDESKEDEVQEIHMEEITKAEPMDLEEEEEEEEEKEKEMEVKEEKEDKEEEKAKTEVVEEKEEVKKEEEVVEEVDVEQLRKEAEEREARNKAVVEERLRSFTHLEENVYICERKRSKRNKEVRRMVCDCSLTKEEVARGEVGCGEDCLNRLLMIECGSRCPLTDRCTNKRFLNRQYGDVEVFNADEKGCGLRARSDLPPGTFIMEYVGEVFDTREFKRRRKEYARDMRAHFYFMALKSDQLIDATRMGNISRFINHSCDPNAETQKWTVNGDLRIGFFSKKHIEAGEEINFDYRLERYGREPQKCYCGTAICRGWLGESPDEQTKEEKDEARRKEERDRRKREERRAYFEDIDLEDEIEKLNSHKLRNRQDTLNLSRLMVRAEDFSSRVMLLQLLQTGESACRRLFLDYHGLKVLWSWMADLGLSRQHTALKVEILKTLEVLPITNKTQLTDSRVLSLVERWSGQGGCTRSSTSSTSLSPPPPPPPPPKTSEAALPPPAPNLPAAPASAAEMDPSNKKSSDTSEESDSETEPKLPIEGSSADDSSMDSEVDNPKTGTEEESSDSNDAKDTAAAALIPEAEEKLRTEGLSDEEKEVQELLELHKSMVELAKKLLDAWKNLKEFFRIPKKERIELMKEHEREVDRGYKEYLDQASESDRDSERDRDRRDKDRYNRRDHHYDRRRRSPDREKDRYSRGRGSSREDRSSDSPKMSKEQRRQLFELKVQQQEEEAKQRKMQEEMWTMHVDRCRLLGHDPYLTPIFDPTYQYFWDPVAANWQPYTGSVCVLPDPNLPVPAAYGLNKGEGDGSPMTLVMAGAQGCRLGGAGELPGLGQGGPDDPLNPANIPLPGEVPMLPPGSPSQGVDGTPPHAAKLMSIPLPGEPATVGLEGVPGLGGEGAEVPSAITIHLPARWRVARDADGHVYFYHVKTRITQWEPPTILTPGLASDSSSSSSSSSDSDSSSTTDSEDFSTEEEEEEAAEEVETVERSEVSNEKMIRHPKNSKRRRSEALVQERVISPILEIDKEAARRERREAKERAREEARQERQEERNTRTQKEEQIQQTTDQQQTEEEVVVAVPGERERERERDRERERERRAERHEARAKREKVKSKERAATAIADNSDAARKIKDTFRSKMATFIVSVLNPYRRGDCREGKITCTEDFKYLARKLTHFVMVKELKQLHSIEALECSDSVKHKTRDFVRKYMSKYGSVFKRDPNDTKEY